MLHKTYQLNNLTLTNEILISCIENFWQEIFEPNKDNKHLMIQCKVNFSDNDQGYKSLTYFRKVNYGDKDLFIDHVLQRLTILSDSYTSSPLSEFIVSYLIREGLCDKDNRSFLVESGNKMYNHYFNNMQLPISMKPTDYGKIEGFYEVDENGLIFNRYFVNDGKKTFKIDMFERSNVVTILGNYDLTWTDTNLDINNPNSFKREIRKSTIYFLNGEIVLRKQELSAKPFRKLNIDNKLNNKFFTMDIETRIEVEESTNQLHKPRKIIPYLICGYDGNDQHETFHVTSLDQKTLFEGFINKLLSRVEPGSSTIIYAHNLSSFDGIFLLKHLFSYGEVKPLLFNGKLISIKVIVKGKNKSENKILFFKDSMLLLPQSLRNLCKAFKVETVKGYFPFLLNDIHYSGVLPKYEYWPNITPELYENLKMQFKNKMWSYSLESLKYCAIDCVSLHQVLTKFAILIHEKYKVDAHKALTAPSLSMRIFKANFMKPNTIYQILGKQEWNIRDSYTGGATDLYIPHNRINSFTEKTGNYEKLYSYDVNALYPTTMAYKNMPIGKPIVFEGDIRQIDSKAFGFFFCEIISPDNLEHPILQRRIKTNNGIRTIAGLGSWTGWLFSEEMDNAVKYGYQFKIIKGYQFEKGNIFNEFILDLYNLRLKYPKGDPMNYIAKLLQNSLYGKFGMKLEATEVSIYNINTETGLQEFNEFFDLYCPSIQEVIDIDNFKLVVRNTKFSYYYDEKEDMFHGQDINIGIASAITAHARIHMSFFKNNPNFKLYYSDTDSIVINQQLPDYMIGNELGQVKLEHTITKAVFLAPKVYGFITTDGQEIIKAAGLNKELIKNIKFNDLEALLNKDAIKLLKQDKIHKELYNANISVLNTAYTLKTSSNKRQLIYNNNGVFVNTKPLNYGDLTPKK